MPNDENRLAEAPNTTSGVTYWKRTRYIRAKLHDTQQVVDLKSMSKEVSDRTGLPVKVVNDVFWTWTAVIVEMLLDNKAVRVPTFGYFYVERTRVRKNLMSDRVGTNLPSGRVIRRVKKPLLGGNARLKFVPSGRLATLIKQKLSFDPNGDQRDEI